MTEGQSWESWCVRAEVKERGKKLARGKCWRTATCQHLRAGSGGDFLGRMNTQRSTLFPAKAFWVLVALGLLAIPVGVFYVWKFNQNRKRAEWKTATLPALASLSLTNYAIAMEYYKLKSGLKAGETEWIGDKVLVMTNGQYLIYASRHGREGGIINHLFLARGSDDEWLYSTYHFCNSMVGARGDDPPGSINEFVARYSCRFFDGRSDVCLEHTWP